MDELEVGRYKYQFSDQYHVKIILIQKDKTEKIYGNLDVLKSICSCSDYQERNLKYTTNDIRLLCRHLVDIYANSNYIPESISFYKNFIKTFSGLSGGMPYFEKIKQIKLAGNPLVLFYNSNDQWVNIYFENKKYCYGRNIEQWVTSGAYNCSTGPPENEKEIISLIKKL